MAVTVTFPTLPYQPLRQPHVRQHAVHELTISQAHEVGQHARTEQLEEGLRRRDELLALLAGAGVRIILLRPELHPAADTPLCG